ncbi:hypothetical protein HGRIS_007122 [Hohenbuehelia grisea]|uniref:DyP dimeric alpha+beta barrel domain-containing protein n=1 Tax=Hohenbuehelia grisea TaxID=104357 RepID=A0ABR3JB35_9AGAR
MWSSFKFGLAVSFLLPYALLPGYGYVPKTGLIARQKENNGSDNFLFDYPGQTKLPSLEDLIRLNSTNGTFLPVDDIQGDILIGMKKPKQLFFFYQINDAPMFKAVLRRLIYPFITSTSQLICTTCPPIKVMLNVAWNAPGLKKLNVFDDLLDPHFNLGQVADADALGDVPGRKTWVPPLAANKTHGVFLIASDDDAAILALLNQITTWLGTSITEIYRLSGAHRTGAMEGHEHFGFLDGISQPAVAGFATSVMPGQSLIFPGTILTNVLGDPNLGARPGWTKHGSFLAFRQLQQFVPEFDQYLLNNALNDPSASLTVAQGAELLGARMVGRWKSGAPIDLHPLVDNPAVGADPNQNNNFDFNHPLPFNINTDQKRCPWSAHIRKTNPRADQPSLGNHIMRAGIPYGRDSELLSTIYIYLLLNIILQRRKQSSRQTRLVLSVVLRSFRTKASSIMDIASSRRLGPMISISSRASQTQHQDTIRYLVRTVEAQGSRLD